MYFAKVTQTYSPANKLHDKIQQLVRLYNRYTLEDNQVVQFKNDINKVIKKLCEEHPRCKPVKPTWYNPDVDRNDMDYSLSFGGDSIICFTLYKVEGVYDGK
jgi:hypothetical protein